MSASFEIHSSAGKYDVEIGTGIMDEAIRWEPKAIIVCDRFFEERLRRYGLPVVAVDATEGAKSLDRMSEIIVGLREAGATRDSTLIAIGGGVIQDVVTFCASIFMRGVPWLYVPTTLLGMVDSCIGGKSSINVGKYKNIVGNFFPPKAVAIDSTFVESLSAEKRIAGLCEAVKICFARDDESFDAYLASAPAVEMTAGGFIRVIELSLRAKKWFIETDEFDRKERLLLNFGHTFGHAIEGGSNFAVAHGVAVGIGMLAAIDYAQRLGIVRQPAERTIRLATYVSSLLARLPELGLLMAKISIDGVLDRFGSDKKHGADFFTVIVPNAKGGLERIRVPRDPSNMKNIKESFASVLSKGVAAQASSLRR